MSEQPKKIMLLHPMVKGAEKYAGFFAGAIDVEVVGLSRGRDTAHRQIDYLLAGTRTVIKVRLAEGDGFKVVTITCHGDPELYPLADAVRIPILGHMENTYGLCYYISPSLLYLHSRALGRKGEEDSNLVFGSYEIKHR